MPAIAILILILILGYFFYSSGLPISTSNFISLRVLTYIPVRCNVCPGYMKVLRWGYLWSWVRITSWDLLPIDHSGDWEQHANVSMDTHSILLPQQWMWRDPDIKVLNELTTSRLHHFWYKCKYKYWPSINISSPNTQPNPQAFGRPWQRWGIVHTLEGWDYAMAPEPPLTLLTYTTSPLRDVTLRHNDISRAEHLSNNQGPIEVWFGLLGLTTSATARVISRFGLVC